MEEVTAFVSDNLVYYGMQVVAAVAILVAGWIASRWLSGRVRKMMTRSERIDDTVAPLLAKITRVAVLLVTLLVVLGQFGVETASLIAMLSVAGLAIGLALQGTLSNIASGLMLLTLRPFNAGDAVDVAGTSGVIDEIGLFMTRMHTFDNRVVTLPNSSVWGSKIENFTALDTRRVELEIGISYDDDMDRAMGIIREILSDDDRVLPEPEPLIAVSGLGDNAVSIRVRPWTETPNLWPLRYDLIKKIKERFDEEEISFPYPQRDVHLFDTRG